MVYIMCPMMIYNCEDVCLSVMGSGGFLYGGNKLKIQRHLAKCSNLLVYTTISQSVYKFIWVDLRIFE